MMLWLLVGYMWLFVHRPFEVWPWIGEYRVERLYVLVTLIYWAFFVPKGWKPGRAAVPVLLLAGTYFIASQTSSYADFSTVEDWFKTFVFFLLVVTSVKTQRELKILIVGFVSCIAVYELHSLYEFFNGRYVWRMGTKRMVAVGVTRSDPNSFGASVVYALPWLYPMWNLAVKRWQKLSVVALLTLGATCVLLTGSRSSFVGLVAVALIGGMMSKHRVRIVVMCALIPLIWAALRPDLRDRYMSIVDPTKGVGGATESAEGRTDSFLHGMRSFAKNPLTGGGLGSYRAETGFATHNLYNDAMGELGLFGLAVLVGFAWAFSANWVDARRMTRGCDELERIFLYRVCLAALGTCVLLFVLGWAGHNLARYNWLWCGAFSGLAVHFLRDGVEGEGEQLSDCAQAADGSAFA